MFKAGEYLPDWVRSRLISLLCPVGFDRLEKQPRLGAAAQQLHEGWAKEDALSH